MALDLHLLENGQPGALLFSIDDGLFARLAPAFGSFAQETGLQIDQYGDFKLRPLHPALPEAIARHGDLTDPDIAQFLNLLKQACAARQPVVFIGD